MSTDAPATAHQAGKTVTYVGMAVAAVIPGIVIHLGGIHLDPVIDAIIFGIAIVGAAFMLAWAAESAQIDISAGLAIALLALIAVLPEYAVDFVFTWKAGDNPEEYAPDALANMTGGNQLLIGAGWSMVVLVAAWRMTQPRKGKIPAPEGIVIAERGIDNEVQLHRSHSVEIAFLVIATVYGLTLPLKRSITLIDAAILVTIFVCYIVRVARAPVGEPHLVGPARTIGMLPTTQRRLAYGGLFFGAIIAILLCAEPFAESLVETGEHFNIDEFVLISLVAPLASEAPEFLIAGLFAWRFDSATGLGALVSSKVNQWTLLVGTLPIVFAISSQSLHGLPIDAIQRELFVTAAQSAFAVAILANRSINVKEALILLSLFVVQLVTKLPAFESIHTTTRISVGVVYLVLAVGILVRQHASMKRLLHDGLRVPMKELAAAD